MTIKGKKPFADESLLTSEDQEAIREKARTVIRKEQTEAAEEVFFERALVEERAKLELSARNEPLEDILIDLPGFTDRISVNINQVYMQGTTYKVPVSVARDLQSMMARAWEHENEVGGANRDAYRKPLNRSLRPGMN